LNSRCITHVKKQQHIDELLKYNPRPEKDQIITVDPRPADSLFSGVSRGIFIGCFQKVYAFVDLFKICYHVLGYF